MSSDYPPGVTDQNFDELAFGETYRLGRECIVCHEPLPDQADEFCSYCEPELTYEEGCICDCCGEQIPDGQEDKTVCLDCSYTTYEQEDTK